MCQAGGSFDNIIQALLLQRTKVLRQRTNPSSGGEGNVAPFYFGVAGAKESRIEYNPIAEAIRFAA